MESNFLQRLDKALTTNGIPHWSVADVTGGDQSGHVVVRPDGHVVRIDYKVEATSAQITQGDNFAMTLNVGERSSRLLADIYKDVAKLTTAQHTNVWTDISASIPGKVPRKYLGDFGSNAGAIFVMDWSVYQSGATGAALNAAQNDIIALYTQDNPYYLVQPPFDTSIYVPGDQALLAGAAQISGGGVVTASLTGNQHGTAALSSGASVSADLLFFPV